jgi:hypothetical protein
MGVVTWGATAISVSASGQEGDVVMLRMRIDDGVRAGIPPVVQQNLTIEQDQSEAAKELIRRAPPTRAVPVIMIIAGAMAIPVVLQMIKELLRQTYYGGVIIDTRPQPPTVTSDPKIPANMVFVIKTDGKTSQFTSNQLSPDLIRALLRGK